MKYVSHGLLLLVLSTIKAVKRSHSGTTVSFATAVELAKRVAKRER